MGEHLLIARSAALDSRASFPNCMHRIPSRLLPRHGHRHQTVLRLLGGHLVLPSCTERFGDPIEHIQYQSVIIPSLKSLLLHLPARLKSACYSRCSKKPERKAFPLGSVYLVVLQRYEEASWGALLGDGIGRANSRQHCGCLMEVVRNNTCT